MRRFRYYIQARESENSQEPIMRLRDLIYGFHAADTGCRDLVERLDPDIADALHAFVAHRQIGVTDFVSQALMELALEAADTAWQEAVEQRKVLRPDAEITELGNALVKAMRRELQTDLAIADGHKATGQSFRQQRVGHPYVPE